MTLYSQWSPNDSLTFFTLILFTFFFSTYWHVYESKKIKNYFHTKYTGDEGKVKHVLFTKYFGLFALGIIPLIVFCIAYPKYGLAEFGLTFKKETAFISLYWIFGLGTAIVVGNYFAARSSKTQSMYPQIRIKEWNRTLILKYALGWCAYLFGYEILFRGLLLIPLIDTLGLWPAIAINVSLYSITHIPKSVTETIGAAPIGFLLCILTLQTGTIWIALFVHIALGLSNSLFALKYNKEMVIVNKKTL